MESKVKFWIIWLNIVWPILLVQGCDKNEVVKPSCSCDAPVSKSFEGLHGMMVNTTEGYFLLSISDGYYKPCASLASVLLTDGLLVIAKGKIKTTCPKPDDLNKEELQSYTLIDSWVTTQDSLFNNNPIKIQLIKSEDYTIKGYGYKITTPSGAVILQTIIPAVGGLKPFKTKTEAYKVAILVAYKLNLQIGFPSITIQDLRFLQIEYY